MGEEGAKLNDFFHCEMTCYWPHPGMSKYIRELSRCLSVFLLSWKDSLNIAMDTKEM